MAAKWKVIIPVGIIALVVLIVGINRFGGESMEKEYPAQTAPTQTPQGSAVGQMPSPSPVPLPPATGNVDDVLAALLSDSSAEISSTVKAMDDDAALVGSDSQAISDFGQVYNENEF